jgi:hypothetical protein
MIKNIYIELRGRHNAVLLDETDSRSVVYMGLKFVEEDGDVFILSTETDIYMEVGEDVYDAFNERGLDYGVDYFRYHRLSRLLKKLSSDTKYYEEIKDKIYEIKNRI